MERRAWGPTIPVTTEGKGDAGDRLGDLAGKPPWEKNTSRLLMTRPRDKALHVALVMVLPLLLPLPSSMEGELRRAFKTKLRPRSSIYGVSETAPKVCNR